MERILPDLRHILVAIVRDSTSVLDYVASGAYKKQPSLQCFIRERAGSLRERGVVVDIWK
ncbi:hypothetical protein [Sulfuricaulis sp.]|uniref:hypothetical protein n=1 Tax=Sulfuricaulis sp. TaxID=2003553 RepID=UPI003559B3F0